MLWKVPAVALLLSVRLLTSVAAAEGEPVKISGGAGKIAPIPEVPPFTPQRETAALGFVAQHHSELGALLARLKEVKREEYEQAIRELFHTRERLALIRAGDERQYALALEIWQVESQIKVLAARHAVAAKQDLELEQELKRLLYNQVDLQRQIVEHNRDKVLKSLEAMNANVQLLKDKREEFVQRRMQSLIRIPAKAGKNATP